MNFFWIIFFPFFCRFFSLFFCSLSSSAHSLPSLPSLVVYSSYSIVSYKRPHYKHKHHRTKIIYKNGESTRRVLLGARMAVREEEQRVRPRVRQPNAHVRGERQRDREAWI